jgi:hypothetical protein
MGAKVISRAARAALSVCRTASPPGAVRWMTSLMTHLPACVRSGSLRSADLAWARSGLFTVDLRDNDGGRTIASSSHLAYVYCSR